MCACPNSNLELVKFSVEFYSQFLQLPSQCDRNVFICPFSVYAALGLLLAGSNGQTKDEILTALGLSKDSIINPVEFIQELLESHLLPHGKATLLCTNFVFSEVKFSPLENYLNVVKTHLGAHHESLPFVSNSTEALTRINECVSKKTMGMIEQLLKPESVHSLTRLMLINVMYFKGMWMQKFDAAETVAGQFTRLDNSKKDIPFMRNKAIFGYGLLPELQSTAAVFHFHDDSNRRLRMLVILPNKVDGLKHLLKQLCQKKPGTDKLWLTEVLQKEFNEDEVNVIMPRFKLGGEDTLELKEILKQMGIVSVFDENTADLSAICEIPGLFASSAKHMAVLEVNEEGAEAAASTAIEIAFFCVPVERNFFVDHPFFVAILSANQNCNVPLFLGHCVDPEPSK
uniref:Serpin n=1 Tax=Eudiplozoon nipponicum TaxID=116851 RepID=A0A2I8B5V4_EUDNI|nr:serpin [Eudiplozoon nipponicum]